MPRSQSLTGRIRVTQRPLILRRDYETSEHGYELGQIWCMECGGSFEEYDPDLRLEWDHILADPSCNELWNLQFVHAYCNRRRAAMLRKNTAAAARYVRHVRARVERNKAWQKEFNFENYYKQKRLERFNVKEDTLYIDISTMLDRDTADVLNEYLPDPGTEYPLQELASIIAGRTNSRTGHGSIQAARNHILMRTNPGDTYMKYKNGSSWFVARRGDQPV